MDRIEQHRPPNAVLIVVGVSQTQTTQARLQVAVVQGSGFSSGWLRSPGTRRVPYVQLIDIAPTTAELLGHKSKESEPGRPDEATRQDVRAASLPVRAASLLRAPS